MKILTKLFVLKNIIKILPLVNVLLILTIVSFLLFDKITDKKEVVSVDKMKVFEEFQMTKESKSFGEKEFSTKKKVLDSLYAKLQNDIPQEMKELLMKTFIEKRDELDSFNQNFGFQESEKIWSRLIQYCEEFSQKEGYELIILSEKGNNILNVDSELDVTNSFLEFANNRYSGFKK